MNQSRPHSPWQFAFFRIVFGLYLAWHFACLIPYGTELFSKDGLIADPQLNPTFGLFPNPFYVLDSPLAIGTALVGGVVASLCFAAGVSRRWMALGLWFLSTALFHRNNLIANPSLPYVGLALVLSILVPSGEPLSLGRQRKKLNKTGTDWQMPRWVPATAAILLAVGYTFSGCTKLASSSWIDGSAIGHILQNPLARPGIFRDLLLAVPEGLLQVATWGALAAELLFLPLFLIRKTRPWIWLALVGMHLSLILLIDFADLSLGMLMIHLFTFDPDWLPARRPDKDTVPVAFDADCLMCNRFLAVLAAEDRAELLSFEPLPPEGNLSTMIVRREDQLFRQSDAVLVLLESLGGHWRAIGILGRLVPRSLRNTVYDFIAARRRRIIKAQVCELPSVEVRKRLRPVAYETALANSLVSAPAARDFPATGITLLVVLSSFLLLGCSTKPLHHGRLPFSLLEIPPGGNHLGSDRAAFRLAKTGSDPQPGDVLAFHMSHADAWSHLRAGTIAKVPYEMFAYGHLALVVEDPDGSTSPRLLQLSLGQPVTASDGIDSLSGQRWARYRPTSTIDRTRLREFVAIITKRASNPEEAYDVPATFGLRAEPATPETPEEIASKYTCVTLVKAALHYAGHPTHSLRRNGVLDVLTPKQLLGSAVDREDDGGHAPAPR